jgi:hypothetical protein
VNSCNKHRGVKVEWDVAFMRDCPLCSPNYLYLRCVGEPSGAGLVFDSNKGMAINVDGICYGLEAERTGLAPTNPEPAISSVHDSCVACSGSGSSSGSGPSSFLIQIADATVCSCCGPNQLEGGRWQIINYSQLFT